MRLNSCVYQPFVRQTGGKKEMWVLITADGGILAQVAHFTLSAESIVGSYLPRPRKAKVAEHINCKNTITKVPIRYFWVLKVNQENPIKWRKWFSHRTICDPVRKPFPLLVSHPLTSTSQSSSFQFQLPLSLTAESNLEWVCSLSHSNHLFMQKQGNNKFHSADCQALAQPSFTRLSQREKTLCSYSNMGNKGMKAKCVRKCWRRCCLIEMGHNSFPDLSALWSFWSMLCSTVA